MADLIHISLNQRIEGNPQSEVLSVSNKTKTISERTQKAYLFIFVFGVIVCWSPNKILPYLVPFFAIIFLILFSRSRSILRNTAWLGIMWVVWIGIASFINPDFIFQNALLAIVTYSTFYPVFIIPSKYLASSHLYEQIVKILTIIILVESVIGLIQVGYGYSVKRSFDINTGDYIEGTIDLPLRQQSGFETPMFATNMAFSLITLIPFILKTRRRFPIFIFLFGSIVLVFSSVVHVLLLFLVSIALSFLIYQPVRFKSFKANRTTFFLVISVVLMIILMLILYPTNLSRISVQYERIIQQENPKVVFLIRLFTEVPREYPYLPYIGIGPGQFSSRASLIASGYYLGGLNNPKPIPMLEPSITHALNYYLLDLWFGLRNLPGSTGSTLRPFASWLSVYSESGFLGVIVALVFLIALIFQTIRHIKTNESRILGFSFGTGLILLFLLGVQENYWEFPQAILIGVMSLKVVYSLILFGTNSSLASRDTNHNL